MHWKKRKRNRQIVVHVRVTQGKCLFMTKFPTQIICCHTICRLLKRIFRVSARSALSRNKLSAMVQCRTKCQSLVSTDASACPVADQHQLEDLIFKGDCNYRRYWIPTKTNRVNLFCRFFFPWNSCIPFLEPNCLVYTSRNLQENQIFIWNTFLF